MLWGLWDKTRRNCKICGEVTKETFSRKAWNGLPQGVIAP